MDGALIPNLDDSMAWAGGTLTRIAPGKMEYVNKKNGTFSQILDTNTDIVSLANMSSDVNAALMAQYGVDLGGGMDSSPNSNPKSNSNKKELPAEASSINQNDFNKSLLEQKKVQLAQATEAVEKIKTQIAQLEALTKETPVTAIVSDAGSIQNDMVLIGTANNGTSKIYSIKQNSWDTKYGYKIRIIPDNPIVTPYYDLTIPSPDPSRTLQTDPAYLLTQIPNSFNVDKTADDKPAVKFDKANSVGMWVSGAQSIVCSDTLPPLPQPVGSCSLIGEQKKYVSNASFANNLRADQKKCTDAGLDKFQIVVEYSCQPDLYLNKAGQ
jgi:hypothetical protein